MIQAALYDQDTGQLLLTIEVSKNETHAGDVEATDSPVEQGANITDHLRPKPRTLTIEGFVSNTPVNVPQGNSYPVDLPGPAEAAYGVLEARRIGGKLHTVVTKLNTYVNMALMSVSEPRSSQVGDALEFTISFKEIRVVQNQTITVQTQLPQGTPTAAQGKKVAQPVTVTKDNATVLKSITNSAGLTVTGSGLPH